MTHAVLSREQAPLEDNQRATAQTIECMAAHIQRAAGDPAIKQAAALILASAGGARASQQARARAVFYWCKAHHRFRSDDSLIGRWFGERDQLELLIEPRLMVRTLAPGDCDDFTMLACALLAELGVQSEIVTTKSDRREPDRWSHVYCSALAGGASLPLDCSHGDRPGWEVPHWYARGFWSPVTGQMLRRERGRGLNSTSAHEKPSYRWQTLGENGIGLWR